MSTKNEDMATTTRKGTPRRRKRQAPSLDGGFSVAAEDQSSLDQYLKEVSTHSLLTSLRYWSARSRPSPSWCGPTCAS
jgi:hypothetical protein